MSAQRIVYVIPTLDRSGAEKQLTLLASRLPRDEFAPEVIALTRGGPLEDDLRRADVPVTVLHKRGKFDPIALWRLRGKLREPDVRLVHTWLFAANAYGRLSLPARNRPMCVVSERCVDSWKARWQLWLDRRLLARTDWLVGNSRSVADFYAGQGVPLERLLTISNGVEPVPSATVTRSQLRESLGIPQDAYVIGSIGRLAPQKRVRDLIWAAETLWQIRPHLHLLIIGDGPERDRLEEFSAGVHGPGHVHFLGHRDDAREWLAALDVFWLGSAFEGMSNSLMEAMAAGLPVVASDIPPNRELVEHDRNGFLVRVGDAVGFMQFTRRLMDEPGLAERLGQAGRERMDVEFSVERMVEQYVELYRRVLATPDSPR